MNYSSDYERLKKERKHLIPMAFGTMFVTTPEGFNTLYPDYTGDPDHPFYEKGECWPDMVLVWRFRDTGGTPVTGHMHYYHDKDKWAAFVGGMGEEELGDIVEIFDDVLGWVGVSTEYLEDRFNERGGQF